MSDNNLSPEEILREKEIAGGIKYDEPDGLNLDTELQENIYPEKQPENTEDPLGNIHEGKVESQPYVQEAESKPLDLGGKTSRWECYPLRDYFIRKQQE